MQRPGKRGNVRVGDRSDKERTPPPRTKFLPYATMFKLSGVDSSTVECVQCNAMYPLSDILIGELNEEDCPRCNTTAGMYWADKPHQELSPQSDTD